MKHCSKHVGMTAFKPNAYLQELTAAAVFTVKRLKQAICFEDIWCRTKISVPCFLFFLLLFLYPLFLFPADNFFLQGKSVLLPWKFAFSWTIPTPVHQSKQFCEKPLGPTVDKCLFAFVTDPGFRVGECTRALTPTFSTLIVVLSTTETNIQNMCTVTTVTAFHNGTIYISKNSRLGTGYCIYTLPSKDRYKQPSPWLWGWAEGSSHSIVLCLLSRIQSYHLEVQPTDDTFGEIMMLHF